MDGFLIVAFFSVLGVLLLILSELQRLNKKIDAFLERWPR